MAQQYFIEIENGILSIRDSVRAPCKAGLYLAPNAKQYFAARGKSKPQAIEAKGWPFASYYIEHGDAENGCAVAWGVRA